MAPMDMPGPAPTDAHAVGCREDPRAARRLRAQRRYEEMGPADGSNRAPSEAAAAIYGMAAAEPPKAASVSRCTAAEREAAMAAREDALSRFIAEHGKNKDEAPAAGPSSHRVPAGRSSSQPLKSSKASAYGAGGGKYPGLGGPIAAMNEALAPPPPRRNDSAAPWAMLDGGNLPPPPKRGYAAAPWGTDEGRLPVAPALGRKHAGAAVSAAPSPFNNWGMNDGGMQMKGMGSQPQGVSANVFASGANQNCGNFLSDKPTSRVLRPPGGGSSFQIGGW